MSEMKELIASYIDDQNVEIHAAIIALHGDDEAHQDAYVKVVDLIAQAFTAGRASK